MKGLSPLVATVLLIAFTIAVAGIVSIWLTGFTTNQTQDVTAKANIEVTCSYGGISFGNLRYSAGNISGNIENTRTVGIGKIAVQIIYDNKTVIRHSLCLLGNIAGNCSVANLSLAPRELTTFNISANSNYESLRVFTNCSSVYDTAQASQVLT